MIFSISLLVLGDKVRGGQHRIMTPTVVTNELYACPILLMQLLLLLLLYGCKYHMGPPQSRR